MMTTTSVTNARGGIMPGRQPGELGGLRLRVSPNYWLRRVTRWPFYFESHNPSFRVHVERFSAPPDGESWHNDEITFEIIFADGSKFKRKYPVPELHIGRSTELIIS